MKNPFDLLTEKDMVYMTILGFLLLFLSFIGFSKFEPTDVPGIYITLHGFPLGWFKARSHVSMWFVHEVEILWEELILDSIFLFLLSFTLIYAAAILRER